ncbi:MAG: ABC transporter substrate-binding protein [Thermodesulfobacteriota bacterium]|jgi:branched-chain amino acid transport system substrate-binding protein
MKSVPFWTMAVSIFILVGLSSPVWAAQDVEIALFGCLSGPAVDLGTMSRDGAVLAAEDVNNMGGIKALGGAKMKLIVADATSTPAQGPSVTERTISTQKLSGAIGYGMSQMTLTCLPVIEKSQVPLITTSISDKITEQGYKHVFEICPKGSHFGASQVKFLTYLKEKYKFPIHKVGFVYENTAYGTSTAGGLKDTAIKEKYNIGLFEAYDAKFTDASPLVTKIKASGVDVIFPVSYTTDAELIISTMYAMRVNPMVIGGGAGFIWPDIYKSLGDKINGVFSVGSWSWDSKNIMSDPQRKSVVERYKKRFGTFMPEQAGENYAAVWVLKEALEKAGSPDPKKVRDVLAKIEITTGLAGLMQPGKIKFDSTGWNIHVYPTMIQWQRGEPRTVYPEQAATNNVVWPVR